MERVPGIKSIIALFVLSGCALGQAVLPRLNITTRGADTTFLTPTAVRTDTAYIYKHLNVGSWRADSATGRDSGKVAIRDTFKGHFTGLSDTAKQSWNADSLNHYFPDFPVSLLAESLAVKAPLSSPVFTGRDSGFVSVRDTVKPRKGLILGDSTAYVFRFAFKRNDTLFQVVNTDTFYLLKKP